MAGKAGTRPGSRIAKVEIHEFAYSVEGLGIDDSGNRCVMKGAKSNLLAFAVAIESADGARGEYCTAHSGKNGVMVSQVRGLAPQILGMDCEAREAIYNKLKRLHRHFMAVGHSALDIALWDLAGKKLGSPVWRMLGGYRERLLTYASTLNGGRHGILDSIEAYADFAEQCCMILQPASPEHRNRVADRANSIRKLSKRIDAPDEPTASGTQQSRQIGVFKKVHAERA